MTWGQVDPRVKPVRFLTYARDPMHPGVVHIVDPGYGRLTADRAFCGTTTASMAQWAEPAGREICEDCVVGMAAAHLQKEA